VAVADDQFEIVIPIDTVVRAAPGSETTLSLESVPEELFGESCSVEVRSQNQESRHPGNDLSVESHTSVILRDVEAEPGGTVAATESMVLDEEVAIVLLMGADGVFSAGMTALFDCPPSATTSTTTTLVSTTTTIVDVTTTLVISPSTIPGPTTTIPSAPTTTTPSPTTTIVDEVLPYTGRMDSGVALVALGVTTAGLLLLLGERALAVSAGPLQVGWRRRCLQCSSDAEFMTPHGRLCFAHTRVALDEDSELWMPTRLGGFNRSGKR
jgi:hypothetical protein